MYLEPDGHVVVGNRLKKQICLYEREAVVGPNIFSKIETCRMHLSVAYDLFVEQTYIHDIHV